MPDPAASSSAPPTGPPAADRAGSWAMAFGLWSFGLALGGIAGLSLSPVAQTLLTSLFTFVGGVLLTFAGFTYEDKRSDGNVRTRIDTFRAGLGLSGFSFGLIIGAVLGIYLRVLHPGVVTAQPAPKAVSATAATAATAAIAAPGSAFGLQGTTASSCAEIKSELADGTYSRGASGGQAAASRVQQLYDVICSEPRKE